MFTEIKDYFKSKNVELTDEINQLMDIYLTRKSYKKNEIILRQGETCQYIFFVAKGLLRTYTMDDNGKEKVIQLGNENWFILDRATVMFQDVSKQYIEAVEDSDLILIPTEFLDKAIELSPSFQHYYFYALNMHVRRLQRRIDLLIGASAEARYLEFIQTYPDITLRVPQWMIASYLGITPESLSRVRKELAKKNFNIN